MMRTMPIVAQLSKAPVLGRVKTRMQPFLSEVQSTQLHRWLTEKVVQEVSASEHWHFQLWIDETHGFFSNLKDQYVLDIRMQCAGNLGRRLQAIAEANSGSAMALIGSDCPFLQRSQLRALFERLNRYDAALIPAEDGGYVCLALRQSQPTLFQNIDWGTERVCEQTLCRAREAGLSVFVDEALADIDRPEDLPALSRFGLGFT